MGCISFTFKTFPLGDDNHLYIIPFIPLPKFLWSKFVVILVLNIVTKRHEVEELNSFFDVGAILRV